MMVYGRTPFQWCTIIEDIIIDIRKSYNTEAVTHHVSYVNRECDAVSSEDLSLNRCPGAHSFVLAQPTPGEDNECAKFPTLHFKMDPATVKFMLKHKNRQ
ncbi:MAG: hypothetical protein GY816_11675 [Cytophagales bacterium]|nr:hypothetical protein [Cytophagales bacterium]